jgi:hypothetical protein
MTTRKETTLTPHHVMEITEPLLQHHISALVWGEMGALTAYNSNLVPGRLFLIVQDRHFERALQILEFELRLERRNGFSVAERAALPLSKPYARFSLAPPRSALPTPAIPNLSKAYLQLFKASDVGLDHTAWATARIGKIVTGPGRSGTLLVPNPAAFLQITAHLYRHIFDNRARYKHYEVSGAFAWITYILRECSEPAPDMSLVTNKNADIARLICQGLPPSMIDMERWGFGG